MLKYISKILAVLVLFSSLPACSSEAVFPVDSLFIVTAKGKVKFTVEVATTELQLEQGLMFRTKLEHDHGMIFDMAKPKRIAMWMKNTLIPLDMVFIDSNGIITQIEHNAEPQSTRLIFSSDNNVRAVLEMSGGVADDDHIAVGDRVVYSIFK